MWSDAAECGDGGCTRPHGHDGMHADYRPREDLIGRRGPTPVTVHAVVLAALLVIIALVSVIRWVQPDRTIPVRTYNGVTWQGDQCRVLEELAVIVCRGPIA
jgi:hypothetical protein